MARIGADVDQLDQLARTFRSSAVTLRGLAADVDAAVRSTWWEGIHADGFRTGWSGADRARMDRIAAALAAAADRLVRQAAQQRQASEGLALAGPGVGGGGSAALTAPGGGLLGNVWDFLAGDLGNLWRGSESALPIGALGAALLRAGRTGSWLRLGMPASRFPTFNTGVVGQRLAGLLARSDRLAPVGRWLGTPGATMAFRRLGVLGGGVSTVVDTHRLIEHGNPVDAYQREGAGYVADVFQTGFSASTTAFMAFPNPYTGGAVIVTGVGWAGAEVVDHWDDISDWAGDTWDSGAAALDRTWDSAWETGGDLVEDAGDLLDDAGDLASRGWDAVTPW